jgi:hypothetical protein
MGYPQRYLEARQRCQRRRGPLSVGGIPTQTTRFCLADPRTSSDNPAPKVPSPDRRQNAPSLEHFRCATLRSQDMNGCESKFSAPNLCRNFRLPGSCRQGARMRSELFSAPSAPFGRRFVVGSKTLDKVCSISLFRVSARASRGSANLPDPPVPSPNPRLH